MQLGRQCFLLDYRSVTADSSQLNPILTAETLGETGRAGKSQPTTYSVLVISSRQTMRRDLPVLYYLEGICEQGFNFSLLPTLDSTTKCKFTGPGLMGSIRSGEKKNALYTKIPNFSIFSPSLIYIVIIVHFHSCSFL